jgi:hypothetical protein
MSTKTSSARAASAMGSFRSAGERQRPPFLPRHAVGVLFVLALLLSGV